MKRFHPFGMPLPYYAPDDGGAAAAAAAEAAAAKPDAAAEAAAAAAAAKPDAAAEAAAAAAAKPAARGTADTAITTGADGKPIKEVAAPADFPADWREKLATGADGKVDEKRLTQLKRLPSPADLGKSWFDAQEKIRTGKPGDDPMPGDDKPEEQKAWRAARDIPDDPTGYQLPKDLQEKLLDEDKPVLADYAEKMHAAGMPRKVVNEGVKWYIGLMEAEAAEKAELDKTGKAEVESTLRAKWGADYDANNTVAMRYAKEAIPGVDWWTARTPDGRALGNIPQVVEALAKFGLMEFGEADFIGGERGAQTMNRLEELNKIMSTDIDRWNASPGLRKEHFDLTQKKIERDTRLGKNT